MAVLEMTGRSFLYETPPFCPTPECYMHPMRDHREEEHHVERCPVYGTLGQAQHRLDDVLDQTVADLLAALDGYRPPLWDRLRIAWRWRRRGRGWS